MATPITWKNIAVEAPQREAYNPMIAAQLGITAGFDKLGQVYDQYQTQRRDDNTAAFQTALSQYKTPEELQAAQASGAIDALRAQFGVQMDQKVAREAADQRVKMLQDQALAATTYTNTSTDNAQHPLVQQYKAILARNPAEAAAFLQANPQLRNGGDLAITGQAEAERVAKNARELVDFNTKQSIAAKDLEAKGLTIEKTGLEIAAAKAKAGADTATNAEILAKAEAGARTIKRGGELETINRQFAADAAPIGIALEKGEITQDQAQELTNQLNAKYLTHPEYKLNGAEHKAMWESNKDLVDFSPYNPAKQRAITRGLDKEAADIALASRTNPSIMHELRPKTETDQLIHEGVARSFRAPPNEPPESTNLRLERFGKAKAEVSRLVGTTMKYTDPVTGMTKEMKITPEDALAALTQQRPNDNSWFHSGSDNLNPWWFNFGKNALEKHMLTPERIRQEAQKEEVMAKNSTAAKESLYKAATTK